MGDDLNKLNTKILACTKCGLCKNRTQAVPGDGNPQAKLMFVGEGPGQQEDLQGIPFCGPSGKFLEELLAGIGLTRAQVYITNIVKCRPPNNRDPFEDEILTCTPYLEQQIKLIKPLVISTLGRYALNYFLPGQKISQVHGRALSKNGQLFVPLYHPAVALYKGSMRDELKQDFQTISQVITKIEAGDNKINNINHDQINNQEVQTSLF